MTHRRIYMDRTRLLATNFPASVPTTPFIHTSLLPTIVIASEFQASRPEVASAGPGFPAVLSTGSPFASRLSRPCLSVHYYSPHPLPLLPSASLQPPGRLPWEAEPNDQPGVYPARKVSRPIVHPLLVQGVSVRFVASCRIVARRGMGGMVVCSGAIGAIALEGRKS